MSKKVLKSIKNAILIYQNIESEFMFTQIN